MKPHIRHRFSPLRRVLLFALSAALVLGALELLRSNGRGWLLSLRGVPAEEISAPSSVSGGVLSADGSVRFDGEGSATYVLPEVTDLSSLTLRLSGSDRLSALSVTLVCGSRGELGADLGTLEVLPSRGDVTLPVSGGGATREVTVRFESSKSSVLLSGIALNAPAPFSFSLPLFFLAWGICVFVFAFCAFGWGRRTFDPQDPVHRRLVRFFFALAVLMSLCLSCLSAGKSLLLSRPLAEAIPHFGNTGDSAYVRLTDALLKGQVNLDVAVSPERDEAANYDPSVWTEPTQPDGYYWDLSYYNGKVYCYFGIAPVLTFYLPVALLSGGTVIPSDALVLVFVSVSATFFVCMALWQTLRYFCRRSLPLDLTLLSLFTAPAAALVFSFATCRDFYYIAVVYGIGALAALYSAVFSALRSASPRGRTLRFCLGGLALVLVAASRPTLALYALPLIPVLIRDVLLRPEWTRRQKTAQAAAFCVPVLIGAVALMGYNAARFSSPFDFGEAYQMTISNVSYHRITPLAVLPALFHYFLQMPSVSEAVPFLHPSYATLGYYGQYLYSVPTVGAFAFPAVGGVFGAGAVSHGNRAKRWFYVSLPLIAVAVAVSDFALGGVHLRYLGDLLFPLFLVGASVLLEVAARASSLPARWATAVRALVRGVLIATLLVGIALVFDNERDVLLPTLVAWIGTPTLF